MVGCERVRVTGGSRAATPTGAFAALRGHPAGALARFADQHQATDIVLARGPGAQEGRHRVLGELARRAGRGEVHVLPAQAR